MRDSPRIDLLNPWGRDPAADYRGGVPAPGAPGHAPINYWAWPAATGGQFHADPDAVPPEADAIIVLLRWRGFTNLRAVKRLKARGLRVFVSWKESGAAQIAQQLRWPWSRHALRAVLTLADGAIATTEPAIAHYREYGMPAERVHFIATPYPFDVPGWDFALPIAQRSGIIVGTRQFDVESRRHADALRLAGEIARTVDGSVTVFNFDGQAGRRRVEGLLGAVPSVRWIEQRLPYPEFLREIARHRVVVQRDAGWVPGQIAGDALLCGLVNVGGNGAVQRLAFPGTSEPDVDEPALLAAAVRLMTDDAFYRDECAAGRTRAEAAGLSFSAARCRFAELLASRD